MVLLRPEVRMPAVLQLFLSLLPASTLLLRSWPHLPARQPAQTFRKHQLPHTTLLAV